MMDIAELEKQFDYIREALEDAISAYDGTLEDFAKLDGALAVLNNLKNTVVAEITGVEPSDLMKARFTDIDKIRDEMAELKKYLLERFVQGDEAIKLLRRDGMRMTTNIAKLCDDVDQIKQAVCVLQSHGIAISKMVIPDYDANAPIADATRFMGSEPWMDRTADGLTHDDSVDYNPHRSKTTLGDDHE